MDDDAPSCILLPLSGRGVLMLGFFVVLALPAAHSGALIVTACEAGAKLESNVESGGSTDETAPIEGILDRAPKVGVPTRLVVDVPIRVTGIRVHSKMPIVRSSQMPHPNS